MKLRNKLTGDVLEMPPPDAMGFSTVRVNGHVVEKVRYSDIDNAVRLEDGRALSPEEFSQMLLKGLHDGTYAGKLPS